MPKYKIAISYSMFGYYDVEAENMTEAMELVKEGNPPYDFIPEDGVYINDSLVIDEENSKEI